MRHTSLLSAALLLAGVATAQAQGAAPADRYPGVPPAGAYQGGTGSPYSPRASNIDGADTHSEIAPRLPTPNTVGDGPRAYLVAAQQALDHHQTGAAQEALERAQTRILTRSTAPGLAGEPDQGGLSRAIADARQALGHHDPARAHAILAAVLTPQR